MPRHGYPLDALRKLRDERAEGQAKVLAKQRQRVASAQQALQLREQQCREHVARTAEAVRRERARFAVGAALGADLTRLSDFERAARVQFDALTQCAEEARALLSKEREEEQKLRDELSRLEAEAKLARNHEAEFYRRSEETRQRAEEEAALEQWNAQRR